MDFTKDIQFDCNPVATQDITITYHGFLNYSESITIVYGFGENWEYTTEKEMSKNKDGFSAKITMLNFDTFNFCFRNNNYEWDNNSYCNYITSIAPYLPEKTVIQNFNIDRLIEEILQPLVSQCTNLIQENTPVQVSSEPIDLGIEIGNILSELNHVPPAQAPSGDYSTLEEILSCEVISNTPIAELENNINSEPTLESESTTNTALVLSTESKFVVSPRKLSKLHLLKKRIRLALYKAFVKIPSLIFGEEKN